MKNANLQKGLAFLLCLCLILTFFGYRMWKQNEKMASAYFGMYLSGQYNVLAYLRNSLDVKNDRNKFIDNLALVKGEFRSVTKLYIIFINKAFIYLIKLFPEPFWANPWILQL